MFSSRQPWACWGALGCLPVRYIKVHVGATSTRGNRANFKVHLRKITQNYDADEI